MNLRGKGFAVGLGSWLPRKMDARRQDPVCASHGFSAVDTPTALLASDQRNRVPCMRLGVPCMRPGVFCMRLGVFCMRLGCPLHTTRSLLHATRSPCRGMPTDRVSLLTTQNGCVTFDGKSPWVTLFVVLFPLSHDDSVACRDGTGGIEPGEMISCFGIAVQTRTQPFRPRLEPTILVSEPERLQAAGTKSSVTAGVETADSQTPAHPAVPPNSS